MAKKTTKAATGTSKTSAATAKAETGAKPKAEAKKASTPKTGSTAKQAEAQGSAQKTARKSAPKRSNADAKQTEVGARQPIEFAQMIVNQMLEAQRMWLEITTQQTALVVKTVSDVMNLSNNAPTEALSNWAKQSAQ